MCVMYSSIIAGDEILKKSFSPKTEHGKTTHAHLYQYIQEMHENVWKGMKKVTYDEQDELLSDDKVTVDTADKHTVSSDKSVL